MYFGAADEKGGAVEHGVRFFAQPTCHHAPEIYGGIAESESAALLRTSGTLAAINIGANVVLGLAAVFTGRLLASA